MRLQKIAFTVLLIAAIWLGGGYAASAQTGKAEPEWRVLATQAADIFDLRRKFEAGDILTEAGRHYVGVYLAMTNHDFELAEARLAAAESFADTFDEDTFSRSMGGFKIQFLLERGDLAAAIDILESRNELGAANYIEILKLKRDHPVQVETPQEAYKLVNSATTPNRIFIDGAINGQPVPLLFDTGGENTLLVPTIGQPLLDLALTNITSENQGIGDLRFSATFGLAGTLQIGAVTFQDTVVTVLNGENPFRTHANNENWIFGFSEIQHLGEKLAFHVVDGRVDHLIVEPDNVPRFTDEPNNMARLRDKLVTELVIDGESYACIFDTGAIVSTISQTIFDRHKDALNLKRLSRREVRRRRLRRRPPNGWRYVDSLPITLGERQMTLDNTIVRTKTDRDHCLLGLDTVLAAGGATIDIANLHLTLGPPL